MLDEVEIEFSAYLSREAAICVPDPLDGKDTSYRCPDKSDVNPLF